MHQIKDELFVNFFRVLVEKGLVDEAAKEVHDAGLGTTLKRLAQHVTGEQPLSAAIQTVSGSATTVTAPLLVLEERRSPEPRLQAPNS